MEKLTKSQVIARVKRQGSLTIELYPSNCGPRNQTWVRGYEVELTLTGDGEIVYIYGHEFSTFDGLINSFHYYNCNAQLGNRVHYYVKTTTQCDCEMCGAGYPKSDCLVD